MEQITISDITIDVVRKAIKNIHLAVYPPGGRVRIAAPFQVNEDAIRLFAISKLGWIKRRQRKFEGQERIPPREYQYRESHYFQGKRYLLNIIEADAPPRVVLKNKTYIDLYVRPETPTAKRHEIMNEWYRFQLKRQIPELIDTWERKLNVKVNEWQVKLMKTKWGSCNIGKKRIWLNLELAKKPICCLEYIIVHEIIHLRERHHNDTFLYYMDTFLPNWKQLKTELNKLPVSHAEWNY
ncbi:MAG: putative metal-dependent hydrolase [Candidatus Jettenia ecosi]|uniref:Putative metal-dependent hydrolase n=1 Tax=Candidatus Jettenia ecosi TaxID=2494326 RepID=A0A533Q7S6_9BACT|nr:MAG: putative metal-dependent hydrolase [Candidatus Jettenia ecosi]